MTDFTSTDAVNRIAAMSDPVQRNYHITWSYHELSLRMAGRLGRGANWCTFATWASRQAGQTIRHEDFSHALNTHLRALPELEQTASGLLQRVLEKGAAGSNNQLINQLWEIADPAAAMVRAADAVARGNRKVYAEIGLEFARFIGTCAQDTAYDQASIDGFCAGLRAGDPPDGQAWLRRAFSRYYEAFFEQDATRKAQIILTANIEIGFHEQTRLQPEIQEAMEASIVDDHTYKEKLLSILLPQQHWVSTLGNWFSQLFQQPTPLERAIGAFTQPLRHQMRLFLSAHMMELGFPGANDLRLGKDLQAPYPATLQYISYADLAALLYRIDPNPDGLQGTGAADWASLPDRLHYIGELFRCFQEMRELVEEKPFEEGVMAQAS